MIASPCDYKCELLNLMGEVSPSLQLLRNFRYPLCGDTPQLP